MRLQIAIIVCWFMCVVAGILTVAFGHDTFSRCLMGFVSAVASFSLYIDVRKYFDAKVSE